MSDVSQASQNLLEEVSQNNLGDDIRSNRVKQWVNGSKLHCDQPPLGGDTEAEKETSTGVMVRDNQPHLPSTSNELALFQTQFQTQQPEFLPAAPTWFSLSVATPVFVVPSRSNSTPPSMPMASQTVMVSPVFDKFSSGISTHLPEPELLQILRYSYSERAKQPSYLPHTTISTAIPTSPIWPNVGAWTFPLQVTSLQLSMVFFTTFCNP